jgi:hypothetical protein
MRKTLLYLAAWFVAGVVAVSLASAGVSMVGDQVTDSSRKAPLSAEQVHEELAADNASTTTAPPSVAPMTTTEGPTTTVAAGGTLSGGSPGPSEGGAGTTSTTAPPPPPPSASTKTYNLVGGTATLRFSAAGVTVLAAVPNAGFSVKVSAAHDNGARVEFEGADHRSRVDAWWDGAPRDEVREET